MCRSENITAKNTGLRTAFFKGHRNRETANLSLSMALFPSGLCFGHNLRCKDLLSFGCRSDWRFPAKTRQDKNPSYRTENPSCRTACPSCRTAARPAGQKPSPGQNSSERTKKRNAKSHPPQESHKVLPSFCTSSFLLPHTGQAVVHLTLNPPIPLLLLTF